MNAALVIMAAGLGSRYGGVKQIERLGPDGEILMEYAIYDALRAGFDALVLIIKPEMEADCRALFGDRIERATGLRIRYAFQHTAGAWDGVPIPAARRRPLGTVHAVLSARDAIDRPFAVINADDYYGPAAFTALIGALGGLTGAEKSAMVAYELRNTVSPHGGVTRGVCAVEGGTLRGVTETRSIRLMPDGAIRDCSASENGPVLAPETPVSMNMWGLHPAILEPFNARFLEFLRALGPEDDRSECLLPVVMDEFIAAGKTDVTVLHTPDRWFGLTYREDKPGVVEALQKLHAEGVYPPTLWGA